MSTNISSCYCIGPQNGEPVCPCRMRDVKKINGRYVKTVDLGPVPTTKTEIVVGTYKHGKDPHYYSQNSIGGTNSWDEKISAFLLEGVELEVVLRPKK